MSTSHPLHIGFILHYITLTDYYNYCKGHIQMTSNYCTIDMETENNKVKNVNVTYNTPRIYTTLYLTYRLLNCKGHIQMTSNYSTIDMETQNNRVKKC